MKNAIAIFSLFMFCATASAQTRIMSYNIKYANENDGENSWSQRKDFLGNQIRFYEPDILGVQEAFHSQLEYFTSIMPSYAYIGVGRDGKQQGEYSAILYDTTRYEVLEKGTFWLSETPDSISKGWDAALNRICTYALFRDEDSNQKFWVFNTHFDHVGVEARNKSAKLIAKKIADLNKENHPMLLMGDFNLTPDSEAVAFLSSEFNDSRESSEGVVFGPEGTFNGYKFSEPVDKRIDYIFTSNENINVLKYAVLSDSWDLKYPSDHLPVLVDVSFSEE